jgi:hypothetical protein
MAEKKVGISRDEGCRTSAKLLKFSADFALICVVLREKMPLYWVFMRTPALRMKSPIANINTLMLVSVPLRHFVAHGVVTLGVFSVMGLRELVEFLGSVARKS